MIMTVEEKALAYYEKIINECFKITNKEIYQEEFIKSKDIILESVIFSCGIIYSPSNDNSSIVPEKSFVKSIK